MASSEEIEKVRQEIMRFRELLNMMREKLEDGERSYKGLFAAHSVEIWQGVKEKESQWQLAEQMVGDVTPLSKAVLRARFDAHNLDLAFEELYDITLTAPDDDRNG